MIVRTKAGGYQVKSEEGKPLSKDNLTLQEAHVRLKEVEQFKSLKDWARSKGAKVVRD